MAKTNRADPDQSLPGLLFRQAFTNSSPENQYFIENRMRKVFEIIEHLPYDILTCILFNRVGFQRC